MKTSAIRRKTVGNTSRSCCQDISSSSGETATTKGATASNTGRATPQFSHLSHHRRRHHHLHPFRPPSLVTPTAELMGPFPRVKLPLKFLNGSKVPPRRLIRKRPSPTVLVYSRQMSTLAGTLQHASRECSKPFLLLQN